MVMMSRINVREYRRGKKNDNAEKLVTQGTQNEEIKSKHNTICVGHHYSQTNTNNVNPTNNWR